MSCKKRKLCNVKDKVMNKICTSIEQSKKLIELGIDINTADMCWCNENDVITVPYIDAAITYCPAWSLSVLLQLIPSKDKADEYYVNTESHLDCHVVSYVNCWDGYIHSEYSKESLLDAAFEMVCWLKQNKKI